MVVGQTTNCGVDEEEVLGLGWPKVVEAPALGVLFGQVSRFQAKATRWGGSEGSGRLKLPLGPVQPGGGGYAHPLWGPGFRPTVALLGTHLSPLRLSKSRSFSKNAPHLPQKPSVGACMEPILGSHFVACMWGVSSWGSAPPGRG